MLDRCMELMWGGALGSIPIALMVWISCRLVVRRPATRHALWMMVLGSMFMPACWSGALGATRLVAPSAPAAVRSPESSRAQLSPESPDDDSSMRYAPGREFDATHESELAEPMAPAPTRASNADSPQPPPFRGSVERTAALDVWISENDRVSAANNAGSHEPEALGGAWIAWGLRVRDAALSAPRLPTAWWLGGAALVVMLFAWRLARLIRLVRRGQPVCERDERLVREVCELLGVRRVPRMVVIDRVVTPMVCLGRRSTIVVPRALWFGMSQDARRAILTHELAHLRRRDHWVCWAQLAVSCVFWWHPVTWWAGRRVREEADMSCDAWVISILPRTRRVYAESLLRVRTFLTSSPPLTPAPALGMASSGVSRFSRRITMVMTSTKSPRLSMLGGVAALTAASIGALFAPALACPPEECAQVVEADPIEIDTESGSDASTFERFMARGGGDDARAAALLEEFREMESRMRSLEALIHEYAASRHPGVAHGGSVVAVSPSAPAPPAAPFPGAALLSGGEIELYYWMPDGRLDDLTSLMSRSDVPVLIRDGEDYIAVIGTEREHEVFLAFARMICPEGVKVTDDQGAEVRWQRGAATPSAPSAPGVDSPRGVLRVAPSAERQRAMEELLDAERTAPRARLRDSDVRRRQVEQEALRAKREYERLLNAADRAGRDRAAAQALERAIAEQEAYINALESSAEELERDQEALEREAEEAAERAEQFQESAADAADRISDWGRTLAEWADSVAGAP